jgi:hypothetical protein
MATMVGEAVILSGLRATPELNGCVGTCVSFDAARGRYHVRVDGRDGLLSLKPDNLGVVREPEVAVGVPEVAIGVPVAPWSAGASTSTLTGVSVDPETPAGNAGAWALERMRQVIGPDERLIGVWQISPENKSKVTRQQCAMLAVPCCWPVAVCCAPCICSACDSWNEIHNSTIYALTDVHVWRWVEAEPQTDVCCLGLPIIDGRAYASGPVPLSRISVVHGRLDPAMADHVDECCPAQQVTLGVPAGHRLASGHSADARRHPDRMVLYVDEPEDVALLIRAAKLAAPPYMAGPLDPLAAVEDIFGHLGGVLPVRPQQMVRGHHDSRQALESLQELLALGLITQAEYDAKRAEVIHSI